MPRRLDDAQKGKSKEKGLLKCQVNVLEFLYLSIVVFECVLELIVLVMFNDLLYKFSFSIWYFWTLYSQ